MRIGYERMDATTQGMEMNESVDIGEDGKEPSNNSQLAQRIGDKFGRAV